MGKSSSAGKDPNDSANCQLNVCKSPINGDPAPKKTEGDGNAKWLSPELPMSSPVFIYGSEDHGATAVLG